MVVDRSAAGTQGKQNNAPFPGANVFSTSVVAVNFRLGVQCRGVASFWKADNHSSVGGAVCLPVSLRQDPGLELEQPQGPRDHLLYKGKHYVSPQHRRTFPVLLTRFFFFFVQTQPNMTICHTR